MNERDRRNGDGGGGPPLSEPDTVDVRDIDGVIAELASAESLNEIMAMSAAAVRRWLYADGVTFVLREGPYCYYAEEDAISPLWKGSRFPMEACISGWCMTHGRSAFIPDIYKDSRIPHDAYRPTFVRSLAMMPLPLDAPVAAMGAYWSDVRDISWGELGLLLSFANGAAPAVARIRGQ